jgi:hypothetical protein
MSVKNVPYSKRTTPTDIDFSYEFHGGTVGATGYLKVLQKGRLRHLLTYNRTTYEQVLSKARKLAIDLKSGYVVSGQEFCR